MTDTDPSPPGDVHDADRTAVDPHDIPSHADTTPPSKRELLIVTSISVSLAFVVLMVAVLPAEYNIDPTGIGGGLGLTSGPQAIDLEQHVAQQAAWTTHSFTFTFGPNGNWQEEKVRMDAGDSFVYSWTADGELEYDLHVKPDEGDGEPSFDSGIASSRSGSLTASFPGSHGWAFRNPTNATVTVTVELAGYFRL